MNFKNVKTWLGVASDIAFIGVVVTLCFPASMPLLALPQATSYICNAVSVCLWIIQGGYWISKWARKKCEKWKVNHPKTKTK